MWLVFSSLFRTHWQFYCCGKSFLQTVMFSIKCLCSKKNLSIFFNNVCLPFKKNLYQPLIRPLLKSSFSTNFQGTGLWEGPIRCSRFVPGAHNCSELFQSWSWSQEKNEKPFTKATFAFCFHLYVSFFRFPLLHLLFKKDLRCKR